MMTAETERLILYRLDENGKTIDVIDEKLDQLALTVEHRVTALEVEAKTVGRKAGALSGGVVGGVVTTILTIVAALVKGLF
jgi:tetrahydromethanopterin S-methyltransferase subunit G